MKFRDARRVDAVPIDGATSMSERFDSRKRPERGGSLPQPHATSILQMIPKGTSYASKEEDIIIKESVNASKQ